MPVAQSRITAKGQTSIPRRIREILGIGPGSILEWTQREGQIVVSRATRFSSEDIHHELFPVKPAKSHSLGSLKQGIRKNIRIRRASH
jgi:AbrB family looped-hinge helix DNA binding protein